MQLLDGRLVLSATDLSDFLACEHLAYLKQRRALGDEVPTDEDAMSSILSRLGSEHERACLARYHAEQRRVQEFDEKRTLHAQTIAELEAAAAETEAVMRQGFDVIYQPFFLDGQWSGRADFLIRVEQPSDLGDYAYEVADAKLARRVRAQAILQLCEYSRHVARVQGVEPERIRVLLGNGDERGYPLHDYSAYHAAVRARLEDAVARGFGDTYPDKVSHCGVCRFGAFCEQRRRADDHLSLVARMRRDQIRRFQATGVTTLAQLASLPEGLRIPNMVETTFTSLRRQAALQHAGNLPDGTPRHELLDVHEPGQGLCALPPPDGGDVFFDMEGDPLARDEPLEYLFGALYTDDDGTPAYRSWLGHDPEGERTAFEGFVDWLMHRLQRHPSLHVYHYADYERAALQRLMSRHGTREYEVDQLLRAGVLVDLYRVVYQGVRLSTESYSLKEVEHLYRAARTDDVSDAAASIARYEEWRNSGDSPGTRTQPLLDSIVAYNRVDCESTAGLRGWLEAQRAALEQRRGEPLPRPPTLDLSEKPDEAEATRAEEDLRGALVDGLPALAADRTPEEQAQWLLGQLVGYHHRERRSQWWQFFRRLELTEEQLAEDRDAVGPLTFAGTEEAADKHRVDRYTFAPQEQHIGERVHDPLLTDAAGRRGVVAGTVTAIDPVAGVLLLKRSQAQIERGHPRFLVPGGPFDTDAQEESLRELAIAALVDGLDTATPWRSGMRLLQRRTPAGTDSGAPLQRPGEHASAAALRVLAEGDGACLAVQGPPGSGKTYLGARIAIERARHGPVAVTSLSHNAISHLLDEVCRLREASLRVGQRVDKEARCKAEDLVVFRDWKTVLAALDQSGVDVVGGTSWLFARGELEDRFDTLLVDEAGQLSLADVVAMSRCAKHLVLLGDPRQLPQVVQGIHPDGAGASALDHYLGDEVTIAPQRGLFLERTRRMCPPLTDFVSSAFYEGRLRSEDFCGVQELLLDGRTISGIRSLHVEHAGDRTSSAAEAAAVRSLVGALSGARWRDGDGTEKRLTLDDILVVAPYNAHVACLRAALPEGARIGTVDKFQGQEAAVSIFSMATSSTDDLPRNLEFLFSLNRLNVAISRAKCLSVVVFAPALLRAQCRTPAQMRLVNALCRFDQSAPRWADDAVPDEPPVASGPQLQLLQA